MAKHMPATAFLNAGVRHCWSNRPGEPASMDIALAIEGLTIDRARILSRMVGDW